MCEQLATEVRQLCVDGLELRDDDIASTSLVEQSAPKSQHLLLLELVRHSAEVSILHSIVLVIRVGGVRAVNMFRTNKLILSQFSIYFSIHLILWDVTKKGLVVLPHGIYFHLPFFWVLVYH